MKLLKWAAGHFEGILVGLLGLMTFAGNLPACYERFHVAHDTACRWEGRPINTGIPLLDERRLCLRKNLPEDETLHLYAPSEKGLPSPLRSLHLGLLWETLPQKVIISDTNGFPSARYMMTSIYEGGCPVTDKACFCIATNGNSAALWATSEDASQKYPVKQQAVSSLQEGISVIVLLLFLALCFFTGRWLGLGTGLLLFSLGMAVPPFTGYTPSLLFVVAVYAVTLAAVYGLFKKERRPLGRSSLGSPGRLTGVVTLLLFIFYAFLTLTHTFVAPNGLGVYGGKAKLLFLAGGFPSNFFTDSAWATLQPAYPPGFAFVTLGCYGVARACGEWLTQVLPCVFMSLALLYVLKKDRRHNGENPCLWSGFGTWTWGIGLFLSAPVLWMTSLYYAEPLMLLLFLIGSKAVLRSRYPLLGWILVGACGWIKTEGVVLLLALWLALRLVDGDKRARVSSLLLGLALPLAWLLFSRIQGGTLYDYGPLWTPDPTRISEAFLRFLKLAFLEPWRYGFAYPLAILVLLLQRWRKSDLQVASLFILLCASAFIWVLGTSQAPDIEWHLQSLERLLSVPAVFFFFIISQNDAPKSAGLPKSG
jgi:hypothetical protein